MAGPDDDEFAALVAARSSTLRRTAYLLCGDWHLAEDLVQISFTKMYGAWGRVRSDGNVDAYLRRVLVRSHIDETRRGWWRRETPATGGLPDLPAPDGTADTDRDILVAALRRITPGQRAVLVLRFWEDQSVEEAARVLGCSTGTVKSQTSRGLAALRTVLTEPPENGAATGGADFRSLIPREG